MQSIHPLTKLYLAISLILLSFVLDFSSQIVLAVLAFSLPFFSSLRWIIFRRFFRYVLPVVVVILLLHVLVYPESPETLTFFGIHLRKAGLMFGLSVSLRLSILSLSLLLFFTTTPAHLLSNALLTKGANPRIVYIFVHSLQLVDSLRRKIEVISIAQRSRGLKLRGNPLRRIRAFFPMLLPLIFSYLSESLERGLALELRGLGIPGPKSFMIEVKESRFDHALNWALFVITPLLLIWRITEWVIQ